MKKRSQFCIHKIISKFYIQSLNQRYCYRNKLISTYDELTYQVLKSLILFFFILDECISVKVTKVRDSDIEMMAFATGRYFTFSEEEMNQMLGTRDWDQKKIKVVQKGSRSWVGEVKIYNNNNYMFSQWLTGEWRIYGERATGGADWQWKAGDSIHLSSCVPTGEKWLQILQNLFLQYLSK